MNKLHVLLAEDDADDRNVFHDFLIERNDIVILPFAENGEEVFSFLSSIDNKETFPHLIILDHNMPRMNGIQTLKALKSDDEYAHIPVVIYSTYADDNLVDNCTAAGAVLIASKPLTKEGYYELIDECIKTITSATSSGS